MVQVLSPIAVSENVRYLLLTFTSVGYKQSRKRIECPECHCGYLLLMDEVTCPSESERMQAMEQMALDYFNQQVKLEHARGHHLPQMSMPMHSRLRTA